MTLSDFLLFAFGTAVGMIIYYSMERLGGYIDKEDKE